jgi:hypothetical protein
MPFARRRGGGMTDSAAWAATSAWLVGLICGLVIDAALILAVLAAPRLRAHGGRPAPRGMAERTRLPPVIVAAIWLLGLCRLAPDDVLAYAGYSAGAAALVVAIVVVPLVATAAADIARRSIW